VYIRDLVLPTCPDLRSTVNRDPFVGSRGHNRDSVTEALA